LLEVVGAGGIGVVYRAHDSRLQRDVALKLLPSHTSLDDAARERLLREARAAARLSHPNLASVYEAGTFDGHTFFAMELIHGTPLRALLGEPVVFLQRASPSPGRGCGRTRTRATAGARSHPYEKRGTVARRTPTGRCNQTDVTWRLHHMRLLTGIFMVSALLACGRFTVDDGRADVVGQVIDSQGAGVAGVRVMLIRDRRPIAETTSASDGRFRLKGTPGAGAVFGLQSASSDQGVWRSDLQLLPTGQTDVGQLELETVWAHPEVLWLRGAGFDEQLTRPEDDLNYLWGGRPGEPLLATRARRGGYEVVRVDDDGAPTVLGSGPGLDVSSGVPALLDGGVALFYFPATDANGETVVLQQTGGTAAGAQAIPISRLTWLDARTGDTRLDVAVPNPELASVSVVAGRGAVIFSGAQVLFASVARRQTFSLPPSTTSGVLLATSRALFVMHDSATERWLSRLADDGSLTTGRRVVRPAGSAHDAFVVDDRVVSVSRSADALTVLRFDGDTLEPRVERLAIGGEAPELGLARGNRWVSTCDRSQPHPTTFEEVFEHGLRRTRIGALASDQRHWRIDTDAQLYGYGSWQGCSTTDGFWAVLRPSNRPMQLLRVKGELVELVDLPSGTTEVDQLGRWPVLVSVNDGRLVRTLLPADASLDAPRVLARVPFVLATGVPSLDGRFVFAPGVNGEGRRSIFRVPSPFGATR
jgi:hypothetical protein